MITILVVDDEPSVTDLLAFNLRRAHYNVLTAADGVEALHLARQAQPDLILLDLMLPRIDGLDVCRELRKTSQLPIIMITARGEEIDRVVGLELGADDYLCKPFSVRELMARIKAVLRRSQQAHVENQIANILAGPGGLRLNYNSRSASLGEQPLELTRLEFELLHQLLLNAGCVLSRQQLLEQAWGYEFPGDERAVDSAVKRLRARFRSVGASDMLIETVRGVGYRLQS